MKFRVQKQFSLLNKYQIRFISFKNESYQKASRKILKKSKLLSRQQIPVLFKFELESSPFWWIIVTPKGFLVILKSIINWNGKVLQFIYMNIWHCYMYICIVSCRPLSFFLILRHVLTKLFGLALNLWSSELCFQITVIICMCHHAWLVLLHI